jgi:hypothetical protein
MVLNRQKRSNAGKAPQRFDSAVNDAPPPSSPVAASIEAPSQPRKASVVSKGSRALRALHTPALGLRTPSQESIIQPASLHNPEDVVTAPLSPIDDELDQNTEEEEEEEEEGNEPMEKEMNETPEVENRPYYLETSVILGKKAIYHTHTSSASFDFDRFSDSARQRASEAANKLKKDAECIAFEASIKIGTQKPRLFTIEYAIDMISIDRQVAELLASTKGRIDRVAPALRVGLMASFDLIDRLEEHTEFNDFDGSTGRSTPISAAHKRANSDALVMLKMKKPRETASTRQRATEQAINTAIPDPAIMMAELHKCRRGNCLNYTHLCYNVPTMGHLKILGSDLHEWRSQMKDDPYINVHHPPPGLLIKWQARMAAEKKKAETPTPSSSSAPLSIGSTATGQGISLYVNVGGAQLPPSQEQAANELHDKALTTPGPRATTPHQPLLPPLPSSPIPAAKDEDSRLSAFIQSRINARPSRRAAFERALLLLNDVSVGFSDLATLSTAEWTILGVDMRIKMDLLKHDKIWHLRHPEREAIDINDLDSEVDTTLIDTSINSEPTAY